MLRINTGHAVPSCDGLSRRSFVQVGLAGLASTSLAQVLQARDMAVARGQAAKDTAMILVWLEGGLSQMDTWDMKGDAPAEYRGIWRPIQSNVPGIDISPLLPMQSKIADKFSLVRTVHCDSSNHVTASHIFLTGRDGVTETDRHPRYPAFTAIAARELGPRKPGMLPYVSVPYAQNIGARPGFFGGSYLGIEHNPFETSGDPNSSKFKIHNLDLAPGLTIDRLDNRRALLANIDRMRREVDASGNAAAMDRFERKAYDLVTGTAARKAFDIASESPAMRERYGRSLFGQSALMARRLIEAGSTVVTAQFNNWDHHWDLEKKLNSQLPILDRAITALLEDLSERGLLETTLVMVAGEFGRSPRMNNGGDGGAAGSKGTPGRDHWPAAMTCLIAGGGVIGGRLVGSTTRNGDAVKDRPVPVGDLHATVFQILGVDPTISFLNHSGRPIPAIDQGAVIRELF